MLDNEDAVLKHRRYAFNVKQKKLNDKLALVGDAATIRQNKAIAAGRKRQEHVDKIKPISKKSRENLSLLGSSMPVRMRCMRFFAMRPRAAAWMRVAAESSRAASSSARRLASSSFRRFSALCAVGMSSR